MRYIITNEYLHSFTEDDTNIIISELSNLNITSKIINYTSGGFCEGDYAIFIEIDTKNELRSVLDKCGIGNHLETFVYYDGEVYPEIILCEEVINEFRSRYNTL